MWEHHAGVGPGMEKFDTLAVYCEAVIFFSPRHGLIRA